MKNVFLIVYSRRSTVMNYDLTKNSIPRLGEVLQLDDSVWVVRTDRDLAHVNDHMSMQGGAMDVMFITQLVPGGWTINTFATNKAAAAVLADWLA